MGKGRVFLKIGNDMPSKVGIAACKLVCKGGKDVFELPSVEVLPGAEKAGTKESLIGNSF